MKAILQKILKYVAYMGAALVILLAVAVHRYILADELVDKDDGLAKASFLYFLWLIGIGLVSAFVFMLPHCLNSLQAASPSRCWSVLTPLAQPAQPLPLNRA